MFSRKLKWYLLFETQEELDNLFHLRNTVVYKTMFGEVLLVRENLDYYAFQNKCPHQGKSLEGCWIDKKSIVCPVHQYHFSMESGRGHGLYLEKYELRIDDQGVFLGKEVWSLF